MSVKIRQNLVSTSKYNIKAPHSMTPRFITVHNTANDASANNEIAFMISNNNQVSYHFAVDDVEAVQGLPLNRNGWHSGDGNGDGNRSSIGVEICYSKSGGSRFTKAEQNAAWLVAKLMRDHNIPLANVRTHQSWNGKNCPHRTLSLGWQRFVNMVQAEFNKTGSTNVNSPSNTHTVKGGETLSSIAKKYNTTVDALVKANSIPNPNVILTGTVLTIPTSSGSNNTNTSGNIHVVSRVTSGFSTAADALNNRNPRTTVQPGTYHVFNTSQGMINVTTKQGTAGSWINPNSTTTPTPTKSFFPATPTRNNSLQDTLNHIGADGSFNGRLAIARVNGMTGDTYTGSAPQNTQLLSLLNSGRLVRP